MIGAIEAQEARVKALELRCLQLEEGLKLVMYAMGVRPQAKEVTNGEDSADRQQG